MLERDSDVSMNISASCTMVPFQDIENFNPSLILGYQGNTLHNYNYAHTIILHAGYDVTISG